MTQPPQSPPDLDARLAAFFEHSLCLDLGDGSMLHSEQCCTTKIREAAFKEFHKLDPLTARLQAVTAELERTTGRYGPIDR